MFGNTNKYFLYALGGVIVLGIFIARKNDKGGDVVFKGYDTQARNDTVYIPTSETNIEYIAGNQTISNSDNRSNSSTVVGDNSTVNIPTDITTKPPVATTPTPKPAEQKYYQLQQASAIYKNLNSATATSQIAPQRVKVIQENPSGWLLVETWLGNMWVKDGYNGNTPAPKTHTVQKGDTLWSLLDGNKNKINEAVSLNGLKNADTIYAGANIKLPV